MRTTVGVAVTLVFAGRRIRASPGAHMQHSKYHNSGLHCCCSLRWACTHACRESTLTLLHLLYPIERQREGGGWRGRERERQREAGREEREREEGGGGQRDRNRDREREGEEGKAA